MKKKPFLILFILVLAQLPFTTLSHAILNSDVKKAKEYILVGMYPQAIELLNKRIIEKPTDADAHFLLGKIHLKQREYNSAKKRFQSVMALKPRKSQAISGEYAEAANSAISQRDLRLGDQLIQDAIELNPNINKLQFSDKLQEIGFSYINSGSAHNAKISFDLAHKYGAISKTDIASAFMKKGERTGGEEYFLYAIEYNPDLRIDFQKKLREIAFNNLDNDLPSKAKKSFDLAHKYGSISKAEIASALMKKWQMTGVGVYFRYASEYSPQIKKDYEKALAQKKYENERKEFESETGLKLKAVYLDGVKEENILTSSQKGSTIYIFSKHDFYLVDSSGIPTKVRASTRGANKFKVYTFKDFVKAKKLDRDVTIYYVVKRAKQK